MAAAAGTRVYVGNLSWGVDSDMLDKHMAQAGSVTSCDVMRFPDGRSKGCAVVSFASAEDAQNAIRMLTDSELDGRKMFVREDREPAGSAKPRTRAPGTQIFVGNLPWSVSWHDLKDLFTEHKCVYADVVRDRDGRSRGFGIVRFETADEAQAAIAAMNGHEINGRAIEVRLDNKA